jgi:hypothetical protein
MFKAVPIPIRAASRSRESVSDPTGALYSEGETGGGIGIEYVVTGSESLFESMFI